MWRRYRIKLAQGDLRSSSDSRASTLRQHYKGEGYVVRDDGWEYCSYLEKALFKHCGIERM